MKEFLVKSSRSKQTGIVWVGFLVLDLFLHKTTQLEILKHLAERGNKVCLFAMYSKNKFVIDDPNIHLISIPLRYIPVITRCLFAIILLICLPFYVAITRPRFIIVEPGLTVLIFVWKPLISSLGGKIILDVRSVPVALRAHSSLTVLWFNFSVVVGRRIFDGITTITSPMKRELCKDFQIQPKFVGVWTSGVSTVLFDPEKYNTVDLKKEFSLMDKFVVMYHGYLGIKRGILESINAIRTVKKRYPDVVFFVLGNGSGQSTMKNLVQEIGVQDNVIFHDSVAYNEVPKFIAMSDVGIIPLPDLSEWRNQSPLKLLEYLSMKKVVIVTDIPANRDVLGKSKCATYASTVDPKEIADAMVYTYNNRKMLGKWGANGRVIVEERYSWTKVAEDFEAYLLQL